MLTRKTKVAAIGALACAIVAWAAHSQNLIAASDKDASVLQEVIGLNASCWEDHVKQKDVYAGNVVKWLMPKTGKVLTYGFVSLPFSAARTIEEASHPTQYHMPEIIHFDDIALDTSQPNWVLHGVSGRGDNEQGLDSTCEVTVAKRGTELPALGG